MKDPKWLEEDKINATLLDPVVERLVKRAHAYIAELREVLETLKPHVTKDYICQPTRAQVAKGIIASTGLGMIYAVLDRKESPEIAEVTDA